MLNDYRRLRFQWKIPTQSAGGRLWFKDQPGFIGVLPPPQAGTWPSTDVFPGVSCHR